MTLHEIAAKAREYVERKYGDPPHGGCLEASKFIARKLREQGIQARIVHGQFDLGMSYDWRPHWWVRVGGTIIDVTADQFIDFTDRIVIGQAKDMPQWKAPPKELAGPRL
jgi:hypothetical protein